MDSSQHAETQRKNWMAGLGSNVAKGLNLDCGIFHLAALYSL